MFREYVDGNNCVINLRYVESFEVIELEGLQCLISRMEGGSTNVLDSFSTRREAEQAQKWLAYFLTGRICREDWYKGRVNSRYRDTVSIPEIGA